MNDLPGLISCRLVLKKEAIQSISEINHSTIINSINQTEDIQFINFIN